MNVTYELSGWGGKKPSQCSKSSSATWTKSSTAGVLPVGLRKCQTWLCGTCLSLPDRLPVETYKYNKCQGIRKRVQIQCMHLTLNRMKALLSRASSHLQAFCLSHQRVWISCWSSELMNLHFYTLTAKRQHRPSIHIPALFAGLWKTTFNRILN